MRPSTGDIGTPALFFRNDPVADKAGADQQRSMGQLESGGAIRVVNESGRATFDASITFAPATSVSTDLAILNGSATTTVKVTRVELAFSFGTGAAVPADISLTVRSTANTTGTSTAVTGVSRDNFNASPVVATAVFKYYTAPAGGLGTAVGTIRTQKLNMQTGSSTVANVDSIIWTFNNNGESPLTLRGVAAGLAVTNGATALGATPVCGITYTWTEEPLTA